MSKDVAAQRLVIEAKMNEGDTASTKEIANWLGVKTAEAYKVCVELEKLDILCKYGYKTKIGWEDPMHSNLQTNSLHWQRCMEL
jgi:hypothetical protein